MITTTKTTGTTPSDDRLKHTEQPIPDGIATVQRLQPRHYIQTLSVDDDPSTGTERMGFIADDVAQIAELAGLVMSSMMLSGPPMAKWSKHWITMAS